MGSTAGIVGALLGWSATSSTRQPHRRPRRRRPRHRRQPTLGPDHLAIVLGLILVLGGLVAIARSIHGGLPGALARLGSVAAVAGVTVGLILVTSTAWPPSSSPRPGQPA